MITWLRGAWVGTGVALETVMRMRGVLGLALSVVAIVHASALARKATRLEMKVRADRVEMQGGVQTPVGIVPARGSKLTLQREHTPDPMPGRKEHLAVSARWEAPAEIEVVKVGAVVPLTLRHLVRSHSTVKAFVKETTFEAHVIHADGTKSDLGRFAAKGLVTGRAGLEVPLKPGMNQLEIAPVGSMPGNPARKVEIFRRLGFRP